MGDSDPRTIGNPHYWNHTIEILPNRTIENLILSMCMYYGRNVYFLNPHYREIRTMGGRTNRGPGVIGIYI